MQIFATNQHVCQSEWAEQLFETASLNEIFENFGKISEKNFENSEKNFGISKNSKKNSTEIFEIPEIEIFLAPNEINKNNKNNKNKNNNNNNDTLLWIFIPIISILFLIITIIGIYKIFSLRNEKLKQKKIYFDQFLAPVTPRRHGATSRSKYFIYRKRSGDTHGPWALLTDLKSESIS